MAWEQHAYLVVLFRDVLVAPQTALKLMQAPTLRAEVLLPGLLVARAIWTLHESVATILVDMRLNVPSWYNFLATFTPKRTSHFDIITHIEEQTRHVEVDTPRWGPASRTGEVVATGGKRTGGERSDGSI